MKETRVRTVGGPPLGDEEQPVEARRDAHSHWRRSVLRQCELFLLALLLWPVPILNPIKLLVVLFHEISHVAAAYLSGGTVFGIAIDPGGAGATLGMGGNLLFITGAGYAGSLAVGVFLYWMMAHWEVGEVWAVLCGMCALSLAFGWMNSFTAFFGYGTIGLMLLGAFYTSDAFKQGMLRWVATTCCLYPAIDVASEIWISSEGFKLYGQFIASDASRLAKLTGFSPGAIGALWILAGMSVAFLMIFWSAGKEAEGILRHSLMRRKPIDPALAVLAQDAYHPVRWRV